MKRVDDNDVPFLDFKFMEDFVQQHETPYLITLVSSLYCPDTLDDSLRQCRDQVQVFNCLKWAKRFLVCLNILTQSIATTNIFLANIAPNLLLL